MRTAADFDQFYVQADPWSLRRAKFRDRALRRILAPHIAGQTVLELGCGEGHLTEAVFAPARSVTAADISRTALARAKELALANAHFIEDDMLTMPLVGYDVIVAIECAYYLNEAERSLFFERIAAAHRGKLFILSAPIIGKPYFTDREIQETLASHGMTVVASHNLTVYWNTAIRRAAALMLKLLPLGHRLLPTLPMSMIYQRCYISRV